MNKAMSEIADAVANKRPMHSKLYAVAVRENGTVEVLYRGTLVALIQNDKMYVNTGGWYTATTKKVINAAFWGAGANVNIFQHNWNWTLNRFERGTYQPLNNSSFQAFDRFALPILIDGRGGLTEAESVA